MEDHIATVNNFHSKELNHVSFNQDNSCFLYIWNNEFGVWDCKTLKLRYDKKFNKSLGTGNALFKTNFILFGGGSGDNNPLIPGNNCMLWDDNRNKFLGEIKVSEPVLDTRMVKKYFFTVTENKVFVHESRRFRLVQEIITLPNPKGLFSVTTMDTIVPPGGDTKKGKSRSKKNRKSSAEGTASDGSDSGNGTGTGTGTGTGASIMGEEADLNSSATPSSNVLATIGVDIGEVQIFHVEDGDLLSIKAHQSEIGCLALSQDASMVATASTKGTIVRVFDTKTGLMLYEFRRGTSVNEINNLAFNTLGDLVMATTTSGTVHVYRLSKKSQNKYYLKSLGIKGGMDYSEAKIYLKNENPKYLAGFECDSNNIIIISYDGVVYRYKLESTADSDIRDILGDKESRPAPSYLKWSLAETICLIQRVN